MKTVKLTIQQDCSILYDMRVYSSAVRMAFNRFAEGFSGCVNDAPLETVTQPT